MNLDKSKILVNLPVAVGVVFGNVVLNLLYGDNPVVLGGISFFFAYFFLFVFGVLDREVD